MGCGSEDSEGGVARVRVTKCTDSEWMTHERSMPAGRL